MTGDMPVFKPGDLLLVHWVDAKYLSGWHDREEILQWERDFDEYRSAGFFVTTTARNLVFAEMWCDPGWQKRGVGGVNAIPLNAIKSVTRLVEQEQ